VSSRYHWHDNAGAARIEDKETSGGVTSERGTGNPAMWISGSGVSQNRGTGGREQINCPMAKKKQTYSTQGRLSKGNLLGEEPGIWQRKRRRSNEGAGHRRKSGLPEQQKIILL